MMSDDEEKNPNPNPVSKQRQNRNPQQRSTPKSPMWLLLDLIVTDLQGKKSFRLPESSSDFKSYLVDLANKTENDVQQKIVQIIYDAETNNKCTKLHNALLFAAKKKEVDKLYYLPLLQALQCELPGEFDIDYASFLVDFMLLMKLEKVNDLLFKDCTQTFDLKELNCMQIYKLCVQEIFELEKSGQQQHFCTLIYFCLHCITSKTYESKDRICKITEDLAKEGWYAEFLIIAIELAVVSKKGAKSKTLQFIQQAIKQQADGINKKYNNLVRKREVIEKGQESEKKKQDLQGVEEELEELKNPRPFNRALAVFLELRYMCEAINHLILGDVHFLDPVIADASCELRPPFVLTAYKIVQGCLGDFEGLENCKKLIRRFYDNHSNDVWEEENVKTIADVTGKASEEWDYIRMVLHIFDVLRKNGDYYPDYLYLCKVMSRCRYVTRDQFGIEVDDGERSCIYSISTDRTKRQTLAEYTVEFITKTTRTISEDNRFSIFKSVASVFDKCTVIVPQRNASVPVLPIYSSEKIALFKCCVEGWPIVLRLSRIQYAGEGKYNLLGSAALIYIPNDDFTTYKLAGCIDIGGESSDVHVKNMDVLQSTPAMCVNAFSICSGEGQLGNDEKLRSEDFTTYLEALKKCDIVQLISLCAANHPPFARDAEKRGLEQNEKEKLYSDQTQYQKQWDYQWKTLYGMTETPGHDATDTTLSLQSPYDFLKMGIADEHLELFKLANKYSLHNRLYMSGNQRLDMEMHFYSIHLYTSTLAVERSRAQKVWNSCKGKTFARILDVKEAKDKFDEEANKELKKAREFQ